MTVSNFCKSIFHAKVYKLSIDGGCTCPNRDGTVGYGGCAFCSASGSGDFTPGNIPGAGKIKCSISEQIEDAKKILSKKLKNSTAVKYIAYFQSFTNTYGELSQLKTQWNEALSCRDVVGIAIATRPDCLSEECLKVLAQLAESTFVQLELGLQTSNDETAKNFGRGYTTSIYEDALQRICRASSKIHIVTHLIFGLPGENKSQILESVKYVCGVWHNCKSDFSFGLKITCLYVLKGSRLENSFEKGEFKILGQEEYFDLLKQALKLLPSDVIIHRLTGDPPKALIIEPKWTMDKKKVLNQVNTILKELNL